MTALASPAPARCPRHESGECRSCPHFDVPLAEQLRAKQERVAALLAAAPNPVAREIWEPPAASAPLRFRNKAKMAVSGTATHPILGLYHPASGPVDLRDCPLHVPEVEEALPALAAQITRLDLTPYSVEERRGELKFILLTASPDGDLMVRWVARSTAILERLRADLPRLQAELPGLAVASLNIQPVHQAILEGEEEIILAPTSGPARLLMRLQLPQMPATFMADGGAHPGAEGSGIAHAGADGQARDAMRDREGTPMAHGMKAREFGRAGTVRELPLLLPTQSFFQTNTGVAEQLYATAASWAQAEALPGPPARDAGTAAPDSQGEVWDLFCGVGGFALALAGQGRRVRGVEISASAIEGARETARLMGLREGEGGEVRFEAGDARVLDPGAGAVPALLIVNPPRRGIGEDLARKIEAAGVPRVLYSSCNPASLAADLEHMPSYTAARARLFDMFPHTDHAEVLVELRRRSPR